MQTALTDKQKLEALAAKFYHHAQWNVKAGDYYTTSRADLELYRVVKIEDKKIFTEYCVTPGALSDWDLEEFTTEGFGPCRVWVPEWVLEYNKPE